MLAALCLSVQMYAADKVTASTTLPSNGTPEYLYTMMNGNNYYAGATTTPQGGGRQGLFAFYAVDGVENAYYIYAYSADKWLSYTKAASYSDCKAFVTLSDTQGEYFYLNNYSGDNYQISPYTTAASAQAIYLNWYKGVGENASNTLGLYGNNGATDAGSRYTFTRCIIKEKREYTFSIPTDVSLVVAGTIYNDGDKITVEGSFDKNTATVSVAEGKFGIVSVDDTSLVITVQVVDTPELPACEKYENAWVYPKQQDNVGVAKITEDNGVYVLSNKVLAAGFMKVGDALYFAGSDAMDLVAGTEPFTVAFGSGDNVPASAMTLKSVATETLSANASAIGGAEHYAGVQLVANYEYAYNDTQIKIVWRAVLRDGSHYLRTEMELTGVDDVDMYNVIPMIYNVDTEAAGSAPKVVGNTRGAVLMSDKIFAGLETPTAYNTVGGATGEEDVWNLADTKTASLTASSWTQVADGSVPARVTEATGASYPNVYAYKVENVTLTEGQKVEITVEYLKSGSHRFNLGGADLLDSNGDIAAVDYHSGYAGTAFSNNTFKFTAPYDGTFAVRVFVENKTEAIDSNSEITVNIYNPKEGVVVDTDIVTIQGRWSRNTTLAAGDTWKVAAVVGLVAQDGTQNDANVRKTQKRRSFLAYSERERAVPWRVFPHYNSWYELNIDRNNAAPGSEHTNFTEENILDVMEQWKTQFYDKYGEGIAAFVIDDGWDNYGPWTFHSGFPNEMREMAALAKEMDAGVGAWLGPVGGYGQSGTYRRAYWNAENRGGMQLSNPAYYEAFLTAANNLVCNQDGVEGFNRETDNYLFFKFDGISGQFSAVGPDDGDTGNENAEGIIRLEQYVRENMREDIFFNTTVGTWASPFWYQISDGTWRQEADYGEIGNNSIDREKWITYRDRLVYQNYVQNSPICPINILMTHGFILTEYGDVSETMDYDAVLRELRCAFVCGSGMVELYADYSLLNSINDGKLWEDIAECVAWQKKNADVLPDTHWVGGSPWTGSAHEVYGWASWNGAKATLALRNGANDEQTYTFTLREALEIPANITGEKYILAKSFNVQDALSGLTEGTAIDIDEELTVTLPGSSVFAFDAVNCAMLSALAVDTLLPGSRANSYKEIVLEFNAAITGEYDEESETKIVLKGSDGNIVTNASYYVRDENSLVVTLDAEVSDAGKYTLVIPSGLITRAIDGSDYSGEHELNVYLVKSGRYYRLAYDAGDAGMLYVQGTASSIKGVEITSASGAESIWYFANDRILSYTAGKYLKEVDNSRGLQGVGTDGGEVTFAVSSRDAGKYTMQCTSYLHVNSGVEDGKTVYFSDHCTNDDSTLHDIIVEEVASLPVTITDAEYATFHAPVAVEVPKGVTAHTVTINGEWATLSETPLTVIPANTAVILHAEGITEDTVFDFAITTSEPFSGDNALSGTVAAEYAGDEVYVLANVNGNVGLYKAKDPASFVLKGHAAYLPASEVPAAMQQSVGFRFDFGGTTAVEKVEMRNEKEEIYDLQGRKVENPTAGIYIINGQKVLVK